MKNLVIGATGLLARPVVASFDRAGFQLRLFSRTLNASHFEKPYDMVQGDVFHRADLDTAMQGCDAVHISLSKVDDGLAAQVIVDSAKKNGVKLISIVTGCTVAEQNRWFPMIDSKFRAEQAIISSGIPYIIFRPTWFMESLYLMVRDGKAMILGDQPNPYHWVAADDFARMVANAYRNSEARNKIFYIMGPQQLLMKDALETFCKHRFPEIKRVSTAPLGMLKLIAFFTQNNELKDTISLFAYFQKVNEMGNPVEANQLLGKPLITLEQWLTKSSIGNK